MKKTLLSLLILTLLLPLATADETLISNGGLLGVEGTYYNTSSNLTFTYGDTLFIKVVDDNGSLLDYTVLINSKNIGNTNNGTLHYTLAETGSLTIETTPATANSPITITVNQADSYYYWIATYLVFCKSLPPLTGIIFFDTLIWAFGVLIGTVIGLKVVILVIRAVL